MRKQYISIKETPELEIGAILIEDCDQGNQGFSTDGLKGVKFPKDSTQGTAVKFARQVVMKQPQFFEEVVAVTVPKRQKE